ncbi:hypothetical protein CL614_01105 [archaeon]|nr:hypothetical protein [archaeon]
MVKGKASNKSKDLKKTLGLLDVTFLCVGAIVGSGIFIIPALAAGILGYASLWIWIFTSIIAIAMSTIFAELTSMYEDSGGIYKYVRDAFGEHVGFLSGWSAWVVSWTYAGMLAMGGIAYISAIYPLDPLGKVFTAVMVIGFFTLINLHGIKSSARTQIILTSFAIVALIIITIALSFFFDFSTATVFDIKSFTIGTVLLAAAIIIQPYIGWQEATFVSEEVKNSRKIVPKAIIYGTIIVSVIYLAVTITTIGAVHILPGGLTEFAATEAPFAGLMEHLYDNGGLLLSLSAIVIIFSALNSWITTAARLPYGMAKDKTLPDIFLKLNKNGAPVNSLIVQFVITSIIVFVAEFLLGSGFEILLLTTMPVTLFIYFLVYLSLLQIRQKHSRKKAYYRAPLKFVIPAVSAVYVFVIGSFLTVEQPDLILKAASLIVLGIPLYILVKLYTSKSFTEKFFDKFSWIFNKTFTFWYTKKDVEKVIKNSKLKKGYTVLDFGCGTGNTTLAVAKKVRREGTVVAVDLSQKQLERAVKRIEKALDYSNVIFIKERELAPFGKVFDSITCAGVLGYISTPKNTLKKMFSLLKKGGTFSFMSFGTSLGMPAPSYLKSEESIKELFKSIGIKVKIDRVHKKGAVYWFIYGKK